MVGWGDCKFNHFRYNIIAELGDIYARTFDCHINVVKFNFISLPIMDCKKFMMKVAVHLILWWVLFLVGYVIMMTLNRIQGFMVQQTYGDVSQISV